MQVPLVHIVVLNWNQCDLTLRCLESLAELDYPCDMCEIVLVDNGSSDGTVQRVNAEFPAVTVMANPANLGYAGGNNVGIRYALDCGADYVCVLNNDVTVSPGFLNCLLDVHQRDASIAATTPLIAWADQSDTVWSLGAGIDPRTAASRRLHCGQPVSEVSSLSPFEIDFAPGAALLMCRQALETVGLFDEMLYLYFEETDWCFRAHELGYRLLAVPSAVVWHRVSVSLGPSSPITDYYMLRNHLRFVSLHWPRTRRYATILRIVLSSLLTIAAYSVKTHGGSRLPHRSARLLALRDAARGRWGEMGADVAHACGVQ